MQLTPENLTSLSECAINAAKQAGALISSYANKSVAVEHKEGGDSIASQVVTEVDLLSEKIITKVLLPTCEKYDLALLTEESEDDRERLEKDYFWCVDPMDGTLAFTESTSGYSVSIALVSKSGEPIIGVVYDPVTHTLYSAVKGQGVSRNGKPWTLTSTSIQDKSLTLVCDRGFVEKPYYADVCKALEPIAINYGYSGLQTQEKNGAVLNACFVLENPAAIYFKFPKPEQGGGSLWDFAASAALFHELGFIATDFYGDSLDLNRADSTYMNHRGVLFTMDQSLATEIQKLVRLLNK
ncbi:MAG: hypothetical protein KAT25_00465 [Sulfuriflexus sp.]|nr:hypothetical protein [Sulfuriflexus sp.]